MNAHIVTIGDEILIGQIVDTNSAWMAQQLNLQGIRVQQIQSIGDTHEEIIAAIQEGFTKSDVVFFTGGLGPTKDDITKKAIADYFKVGMDFHPPTFDRIEKMFAKWGRSMTEAHREQCYMPQNALIMTNRMGSAPGMWFEQGDHILVSMPGVPYEMKYLMENEVLPRLRERFPGKPIAHRTVLTVGEGESRIAKMITDFEENLPAHIKLAYLPGLGIVRLRLTAKGDSQAAIEKDLDAKVEELNALLPDYIFGYGTTTLEAAVGQLLRERKQTIATAESCTGGYLAHRFTAIPGASDYFQGSTIAYANQIKVNELGVSPSILQQHGAVSEETVSAMAQGALKKFNTDFALSTSGIAGPGGGTETKPVGTIWMAICDKNECKTLKLQLGKDRLKNIQYTSNRALNLLRKFLIERY
ncbi:MAG: competence/damage-inducible protein A [Bacteroidota bacterium]